MALRTELLWPDILMVLRTELKKMSKQLWKILTGKAAMYSNKFHFIFLKFISKNQMSFDLLSNTIFRDKCYVLPLITTSWKILARCCAAYRNQPKQNKLVVSTWNSTLGSNGLTNICLNNTKQWPTGLRMCHCFHTKSDTIDDLGAQTRFWAKEKKCHKQTFELFFILINRNY